MSWIRSKANNYNVSVTVCRLLVSLDDLARNPLTERKQTRLARMIIKFRHYSNDEVRHQEFQKTNHGYRCMDPFFPKQLW
jgi:hypothetical protein